MNLIKVSDNVLINPDCISCIEQKKVNKQDVIIVWVDGKSYTMEIPLQEFLVSLDNLEVSENKQIFGG